jgi:hypothetical protein
MPLVHAARMHVTIWLLFACAQLPDAQLEALMAHTVGAWCVPLCCCGVVIAACGCLGG